MTNKIVIMLVAALALGCVDAEDVDDVSSSASSEDGASDIGVGAGNLEPADSCAPGFCCNELVTAPGSKTTWCLGASMADASGTCPSGASYVSCDSECFAGAGASGACGIGTASSGECCS